MISELLNQEGIRLRSYRNGNQKITCPECSAQRKHKKDPCLSVTIEADGAVWNCHNCGWNGGVSENNGQRYQPRERPKEFKRPAPAKDPQKPKSMYDWFKTRGITKETVDAFGCTVTNRHVGDSAVACVTYPYLRDGELINRKFRTKDKRFLQEGGTERTLFNVDSLKDQTVAIFVEGEMDVMACHEAGITNVVSLPDGAPSKIEEEPGDHDQRYEAIKNCDSFILPIEKFIIAVDADGPGKVLAEELARRLGRDKCFLVEWPTINDSPRKDANEVLQHDSAAVLRECIQVAAPYPIAGLYAAMDHSDSVLDIYTSGRGTGLDTGFGHDMNQHLKIRPGDLTIITGHPASGKSNWLDQLMINMAFEHNWKFVICSFENTPDEHLANLSEKYSSEPFWPGPSDRMSQATLEKSLAWLNERFWFIRADQENPTMDWILELARAAVRRNGVKGLVIDPWNEIEHNRPAGLNETEYVSEVLGKLRRFAKVNGVHIFFVVHPAKPYRMKDGKYPVPSLYDCIGSSNFANKADFGITVHRPDDTEVIEVHIRKVRHKWLGQRGVVKLRYKKSTGEYSSEGLV